MIRKETFAETLQRALDETAWHREKVAAGTCPKCGQKAETVHFIDDTPEGPVSLVRRACRCGHNDLQSTDPHDRRVFDGALKKLRRVWLAKDTYREPKPDRCCQNCADANPSNDWSGSMTCTISWMAVKPFGACDCWRANPENTEAHACAECGGSGLVGSNSGHEPGGIRPCDHCQDQPK